jgi:hypothetical protein
MVRSCGNWLNLRENVGSIRQDLHETEEGIWMGGNIQSVDVRSGRSVTATCFRS